MVGGPPTEPTSQKRDVGHPALLDYAILLADIA
jgi:hypothetical protein